nr:adenosylcobinamide-GDP ribazoletransferase [uncultured Agathobaculum sp.]
MKSAWSGLLVAFSMYSAVPVPQVQWEKRTMRWALGFLPLVGVLIGALEWLWFLFCTRFAADGLFYAVGAALLPLFVSGGIHLDGLCDTCDALCSYGDREKRLAILKDPHVGAFGPMWLIAFLLAEVGCFAQIYACPALLPLAICGFAMARAMGGCKVVLTPCAKDSGLAHLFAENSDKKVVAVALIVEVLLYLTVTGLLVYAVPHGLTAATVLMAVLLVWHGVHEHMTRRIFGGITGDLAGFYISVSELLALACAALGGLML